MRQWIAIGAAVGLVAVTLPMLRKQDDKIADMLAKASIGTPSPGGPTITREVTPPPLEGLDLTRIDDRGTSRSRRRSGRARRS